MLTPRFEVSQDGSSVCIEIEAQTLKSSAFEITVDKNMFWFSLGPYYLRLRFPGNLVEDERLSSRYDVGSGKVIVRVSKETKGEQFPDLDLISKLLARNDKSKDGSGSGSGSGPLIQEISNDTDSKFEDGNAPVEESGKLREIDISNAEEHDWEMEQNLEPNILGSKYGFNDAYTELVHLSILEGNTINELEDPEHLTPNEHFLDFSEKFLQERFDLDHYLADYFDDEIIQQIIQNSSPSDAVSDGKFTSEERDMMVQKLANKSYLLDDEKSIYIGMISFVFAYCYEMRVNDGEFNVESAWTVGKLVPQISCLASKFPSVKPLVISVLKRSLTFPLYRNWTLSKQVLEDTYKIFKLGKRALIKVFLKLINVFQSESYYVYCRIWLLDYTDWLQSSNENVIRSIAHEVSLSRNIAVEELGWPDLLFDENEVLNRLNSSEQ